MKGCVTLGVYDLRLLRLRRKNRARSKMKTIPPITPPMMAFVGFPGEELDTGKLPHGTLVDVGVFEDVRDVGASS